METKEESRKATQKPKPIISIKEARKLLGGEYSGVSSKNVERIILDMVSLADKLLTWQASSTKAKVVL